MFQTSPFKQNKKIVFNWNVNTYIRTALAFVFLLTTMIASAPQKVIVFDFKGINIGDKEAYLFSETLRTEILKTGKFAVFSNVEAGISDSISNVLLNSSSKVTAYDIANIVAFPVIVWGKTIKTDTSYLITTSFWVKAERTIKMDFYQKEQKGSFADVMNIIIPDILNKLIETKEKTETYERQDEFENIDNATEYGWFKIKGFEKDVKFYINGEYIPETKGKIKVPVGHHCVTVKSRENTRTEVVEISANDIIPIHTNMSDEPHIRFTTSFEGNFMLGNHNSFGACHSFGIVALNKHLLLGNFCKSLPVIEDSYFTGGSFAYMYNFNIKNIFLSAFGFAIGLWEEGVLKMNSVGFKQLNSFNYYFCGPKVRLQIGYKYVFLVNDIMLLFGNESPKVSYNQGISFIF